MGQPRSDSEFEIHELEPSWAAALGELFTDLRDHGDERFFHPFDLDAASATRLAGLRGRDRYLIAVRAGQILAFGMLRGWDAGFDVPSLGIAVHPSARGSGLGRTMMQVMHDVARDAGATRVRLTVDRANRRAIEFYRHLGYSFHDADGARLVGILDVGG